MLDAKLIVTEEGDAIRIKVSCCIQHAWATESIYVEVTDVATVVLQPIMETRAAMKPEEAAVYASFVRYLAVVTEGINAMVEEKTVSNINKIFTFTITGSQTLSYQ